MILQRVTDADTGFMLAIWNDPAFVRNVGDRGVRTNDEARLELEEGAFRLYRDFGFGPYKMVRKDDDTAMGVCGLFKRDNLDAPDIGFSVLPDYCRNGYAAEAAFTVLAHARDDLNIRELTAIVSSDNVPSIGLIEKLGMTFRRMITMPGDDEPIRLYAMTLRQE